MLPLVSLRLEHDHPGSWKDPFNHPTPVALISPAIHNLPGTESSGAEQFHTQLHGLLLEVFLQKTSGGTGKNTSQLSHDFTVKISPAAVGIMGYLAHNLAAGMLNPSGIFAADTKERQ
jgi:hypothetical protein